VKLAPQEVALFDAIMAAGAPLRPLDGNDETLAEDVSKRALVFVAQRRKVLGGDEPS
jgi:hypothetical protein